MSEPAAEGTPPPRGKKILGMDRRTAVFVGLALAVGVVWYIVKSRQSASAAGTAAGTSGMSTQDQTDFAGELSTLQSEFGNLASEISAMQGGTGTGGTVTIPPNGGTPPAAQVKVPATAGKTAGQAHNLIVAAGLVPIADPNQKATDKVTSTSPAAGTSVDKGTRILIVARSKTGVIT